VWKSAFCKLIQLLSQRLTLGRLPDSVGEDTKLAWRDLEAQWQANPRLIHDCSLSDRSDCNKSYAADCSTWEPSAHAIVFDALKPDARSKRPWVIYDWGCGPYYLWKANPLPLQQKPIYVGVDTYIQPRLQDQRLEHSINVQRDWTNPQLATAVLESKPQGALVTSIISLSTYGSRERWQESVLVIAATSDIVAVVAFKDRQHLAVIKELLPRSDWEYNEFANLFRISPLEVCIFKKIIQAPTSAAVVQAASPSPSTAVVPAGPASIASASPGAHLHCHPRADG
jgi:hypothetical protein